MYTSYVFMFVCLSVCMYIHVCIMSVCMYVCMHVCMNVSLYICGYVLSMDVMYCLRESVSIPCKSTVTELVFMSCSMSVASPR